MPQFIDNREVYGYIAAGQPPFESIRLIGKSVSIAARKSEIAAAIRRAQWFFRDSKAANGIFIHSSWRTSSTWFWAKFRRLPSSLAFYEPFSPALNSITYQEALELGSEGWISGHPQLDPYFLEYLPLIRRSGGIRLFMPPMSYDWFIPESGIRGSLRKAEQRYIAFLVREGFRRGRIPVLGFCRSLGRVEGLKNTFEGVHILLVRNLWQQWASYIKFKRLRQTFFYDTVPLLVNRRDDKFLCHLANLYLGRSSGNLAGVVGTDSGYHALSQLPEHEVFEMFMGLHLYLYLSAEMSVDLVIDTTRVARDPGYRAAVERELLDIGQVKIRLDDSGEQKGNLPSLPSGRINWDEIRRHGELAARALAERKSFEELHNRATFLIDQAQSETLLKTR